MRHHDVCFRCRASASSPETSKARSLPPSQTRTSRYAEPADRSRRCHASRSPSSTTGRRLPYDLFLGVPQLHHAPAVCLKRAAMADGGWVPVNPRTLETKYPNVYAIGDSRQHRHAEEWRLRRGHGQGGGLGARREYPPEGVKASSIAVARDRVISSTGAISSAGSTSISSPGRSRPARTTSRAWRSARTRPRSAPRGRRAGSASDALMRWGLASARLALDHRREDAPMVPHECCSTNPLPSVAIVRLLRRAPTPRRGHETYGQGLGGLPPADDQPRRRPTDRSRLCGCDSPMPRDRRMREGSWPCFDATQEKGSHSTLQTV